MSARPCLGLTAQASGTECSTEPQPWQIGPRRLCLTTSGNESMSSVTTSSRQIEIQQFIQTSLCTFRDGERLAHSQELTAVMVDVMQRHAPVLAWLDLHAVGSVICKGRLV